MRSLRQNQRISYDLEEDRRGKMSAVNLKPVDDAAQPAEQAQSEAANDSAE